MSSSTSLYTYSQRIPPSHSPERARLIMSLRDQLQSPVEARREEAAMVIAQIGMDAKICVPHLSDLLNENHLDSCLAAVHALSSMGRAAERALVPLLELLTSYNAELRCWVVTCLGYIGVCDEEVVRSLCRCLQDRDHDVREAAAWALKDLEVTDDSVVDSLFRAFQPDDAGLAVIETLISISTERAQRYSEQIKQGLLRRLESDNRDQLIHTLQALSRYGSRASDCSSQILTLLGHDSIEVREEAAFALGEVRAKPAVGPLVERLGEEENSVKALIIGALGEIGDASDEVIHALSPFLFDDDNEVRMSAAEALGKFRNTELVPLLEDALEDRDAGVRGYAEKALKEITAN